MGPLRFCMVTTFYPPYAFGGDATYVYRLSNALAELGHHVEVIHCIDSFRALNGGEPAAGYANHEGVTVHGIESGWGVLSPLATQQLGFPVLKARRLRQLIDAGRFDVIHFHNVSLVGGPAVLAYGSAVKFYTTHEHWLVCPTHVLLKYGREPCEKPECFRCQLSHRRPPQWWRHTPLLRRSLQHIDLFFAPSEFTRRRHLSAGLELPMVTLPYFVDEKGLGAESPRNERSRPYFLFVGRLERLKGLQDVIPLFRDYRAADLVIAGDGEYAPQLRQMAEGLSNVQFLGRVAPDQLGVLYHHAVALIVPSITYETFGQVAIEAFALRSPVIARRLGPLPEIIEESGGGLLFDDPETLRRAMERIQHEPGCRNDLGAAGYAAFRARWSREAHLERYLSYVLQRTSGADLTTAG